MKKKLLFINGHLNTGGVEKSLLDILTHLDYDKYEVDLLLVEQLGDYATQIPEQVNIIFKSIEKTYGPFLTVIKTAIKNKDWFSLKMRLIFLIMKVFGQKQVSLASTLLTGKKHYDCVIGFRSGFCTQIAALAVNADKKITWWHHGEINIDVDSYAEVAIKCDTVVAVSDYCKQMLIDKIPVLKDKIVVINNIVDDKAIKNKAAEFDPCYDEEKIHIVSVGRLALEKHYDNAVYAAKVLKEKDINFKWHLVGDGILREELEHMAIDMEIEDCFIFEGNQVNPYPYIKHADLFVHPSYVESFGIVVAEALALGIPCVVTKSEGVLELLEDGENAILTEKNRESLVEKIVELLENKELYKIIEGNSVCNEQVIPNNIIKKLEKLIEE